MFAGDASFPCMHVLSLFPPGYTARRCLQLATRELWGEVAERSPKFYCTCENVKTFLLNEINYFDAGAPRGGAGGGGGGVYYQR